MKRVQDEETYCGRAWVGVCVCVCESAAFVCAHDVACARSQLTLPRPRSVVVVACVLVNERLRVRRCCHGLSSKTHAARAQMAVEGVALGAAIGGGQHLRILAHAAKGKVECEALHDVLFNGPRRCKEDG